MTEPGELKRLNYYHTHAQPEGSKNLTNERWQTVKHGHSKKCSKEFIVSLVDKKPYGLLYNEDNTADNSNLGENTKESNEATKTRYIRPMRKSHLNYRPSKSGSVDSSTIIEGKPKITVVADSQGKELAIHLNRRLGSTWEVYGNIKSGAPLEVVTDTAVKEASHNYTKKDCVVLLGGTNNVANNKFRNNPLKTQELIKFLQTQVRLFNRTNLILCTIPYRYDLHSDDEQNKVINHINMEIRKLAYRNNNTSLVDTWTFSRWQHTRHGLHFNKKGKLFLTNEIESILLEISSHEECTSTPDTRMPEGDSCLSTACCDEPEIHSASKRLPDLKLQAIQRPGNQPDLSELMQSPPSPLSGGVSSEDPDQEDSMTSKATTSFSHPSMPILVPSIVTSPKSTIFTSHPSTTLLVPPASEKTDHCENAQLTDVTSQSEFNQASFL